MKCYRYQKTYSVLILMFRRIQFHHATMTRSRVLPSPPEILLIVVSVARIRDILLHNAKDLAGFIIFLV